MPGTILLSALFDVASKTVVYACAAVAFGGLILALAAADTHDRSGHQPEPVDSPSSRSHNPATRARPTTGRRTTSGGFPPLLRRSAQRPVLGARANASGMAACCTIC